MSTPLLECRRVRFAHPDGPDLFADFDLAVEAGGYYAVRGPSGAGKSTLLRLLCRLEEPVSGEILFQGRPLAEYAPPGLRRTVCLIQQTPQVLPISVRENLLLPFTLAANASLPQPDDQDLLARLHGFRLADVALTAQAASLSVGQRQRLCLIRALLLGPKALLLDEPTSALDPESAAVVMAEIARVNAEEGVTVIMVTHAEGLKMPAQAQEIRVGGDGRNGDREKSVPKAVQKAPDARR